jgi:hypothetical protein
MNERQGLLPRRRAGSQVCEDGEHAPVRISVRVEAELEKDLFDVSLDGALGYEEPLGDRAVRQSLGDDR